MLDRGIEVGNQVYVEEGGKDCGAVRAIRARSLVVFFENHGDAEVPLEAVQAAHDAKVILDERKLPPQLRLAIHHAHDREQPGL